MPSRTTEELPAVVSVSEMARRVGLSRSRFYDLVKAGVFPQPIYSIRTRRPMFLTEQQAECLKVRSSNVGVNGQYVLFYSRRESEQDRPARRAPRDGAATGSLADAASREVMSGLQALGMASVTPQQVQTALRRCFPNGWQNHDDGEVLRTCWTHLWQLGAA